MAEHHISKTCLVLWLYDHDLLTTVIINSTQGDLIGKKVLVYCTRGAAECLCYVGPVTLTYILQFMIKFKPKIVCQMLYVLVYQ